MKPTGHVYLPILLDMTGQKALVVGGGRAGLQKVNALLPFDLRITVVSPEFLPEFSVFPPSVTVVRRPWVESDLDGHRIVYCCTSDPEVNRKVTQEARSRGILVNQAAEPSEGDFISPASHKEGPYLLSVSSGGQEPKKAVMLRDVLIDAMRRWVRNS